MIRVSWSEPTPSTVAAGVIEIGPHIVRPWCGLCGWTGLHYSVAADVLAVLVAQRAAADHDQECPRVLLGSGAYGTGRRVGGVRVPWLAPEKAAEMLASGKRTRLT